MIQKTLNNHVVYTRKNITIKQQQAGNHSDKRSWLRKAIQIGSWTAYTWRKMSMTVACHDCDYSGKLCEERRNSSHERKESAGAQNDCCGLATVNRF